MLEIRIEYNFKSFKGKPKFLLEKIEGCKIKSYGTSKDTVTLIFLADCNETKDIAISELKKIGISEHTSRRT